MVIAEIGINHNGDLDIAKKLIDAAAHAGCGLVKFQKRTVEKVYTREFLDSPRQSPWGSTQRDQKMALEFGQAEYEAIDAYCRKKGIGWFASAWDTDAQLFLRQFDLEYNKVASAMLTNNDLLELIAEEGKPTYISTGMSTWEEIDTALSFFSGVPYTLMHTNSTYPMPEEDANLRMMAVLRERYSCPVGYSGHEQGIFVSMMAFILGAVAVERHITLDREMYGSDQAASLEPEELKQLVSDYHRALKVMGDGSRNLTPAECAVRNKLRPAP